MEELFIDAITKNKDTIYRICTAYAPVQEDAKDMFQEVLINIWGALPGFRDKSSIDTWIYRITINVCLRAKQKDIKRKKYFLTAEEMHLDSLHIAVPASKSYPELYNCIRKLNELDRSVIMLFLENLSYKEIAEVTGLTENNIAVKIMRIKTKLFGCLKTYNERRRTEAIMAK